MLVEGLFLPLTTPFYADGRLNLRKMDHNVHLYSKTPAAGMVVLSRNGESTLLTEEEVRDVMRASVEAAAAEKVMLVDISRDSVAETGTMAEFAASLGYDAVLVGVPSVLGGGGRRKELLVYFQMVADRSPLPVLLASGADVQNGLLDRGLIVDLAQHRNIIGLADASGDSDRIGAIQVSTARVKREVKVTMVFAAVTGRMLRQQDLADGTFVSAATLTGGAGVLTVAPPQPAMKTRTKSVGFQILTGNTARMLEGFRAGASGAAPAFAVCGPQACYEVLAAWKDGDEGLADEKQTRIQKAARRIEVELGVPGIKYGCDLNGYYGGGARLPLLPLSGEERVEIETLMQGIRS